MCYGQEERRRDNSAGDSQKDLQEIFSRRKDSYCVGRLARRGRNPADAVAQPKLKRKEMNTLNGDQARIFLSCCEKETRFGVLFWIALSTGMRQGELLGLKWSDLDWKTRKLHVQRQIQRLPGKGLVFSEPKSAAGRRVILLSQISLEKLKEHLDTQRKSRILAGDRWVENDLIFPSTIGTPLDQKNLNRVFKEVLRMSGVTNIRTTICDILQQP